MTQLKNKKNAAQKRGTLDQKHTEYINKFAALNESLPEKRAKLLELQLDLKELGSERRRKNKSGRKMQLQDSIDKLKKEIYDIENCTESLNYISSTYDILIDYYGNKSVADDGIDEDLIQECGTAVNNKKNILSYLFEDIKESDKGTDKSDVKCKSNRRNKAQLYESYRKITDINYRKGANRGTYIPCQVYGCGGERKLIPSDACVVCLKCGRTEPELVFTDKPNYKEPTQDTGSYAYKRINHLTEIMSQLQAKESTDIPPKVIESIFRELKKRGIHKNDLEIFRLRRILKKLNYRKYYEHVPHILQIINHKEPPNFSRRAEMTIKKMFKDIQKPFAIYCPKNRKNFLNYSYVLHKFCQLLGLDDYINYFPLLKNNSKLLQHDRIWKNICGYMKWKYYKSI